MSPARGPPRRTRGCCGHRQERPFSGEKPKLYAAARDARQRGPVAAGGYFNKSKRIVFFAQRPGPSRKERPRPLSVLHNGENITFTTILIRDSLWVLFPVRKSGPRLSTGAFPAARHTELGGGKRADEESGLQRGSDKGPGPAFFCAAICRNRGGML